MCVVVSHSGQVFFPGGQHVWLLHACTCPSPWPLPSPGLGYLQQTKAGYWQWRGGRVWCSRALQRTYHGRGVTGPQPVVGAGSSAAALLHLRQERGGRGPVTGSCETSVLPHLDRWCSPRPQCSLWKCLLRAYSEGPLHGAESCRGEWDAVPLLSEGRRQVPRCLTSEGGSMKEGPAPAAGPRAGHVTTVQN